MTRGGLDLEKMARACRDRWDGIEWDGASLMALEDLARRVVLACARVAESLEPHDHQERDCFDCIYNDGRKDAAAAIRAAVAKSHKGRK